MRRMGFLGRLFGERFMLLPRRFPRRSQLDNPVPRRRRCRRRSHPLRLELLCRRISRLFCTHTKNLSTRRLKFHDPQKGTCRGG